MRKIKNSKKTNAGPDQPNAGPDHFSYPVHPPAYFLSTKTGVKKYDQCPKFKQKNKEN